LLPGYADPSISADNVSTEAGGRQSTAARHRNQIFLALFHHLIILIETLEMEMGRNSLNVGMAGTTPTAQVPDIPSKRPQSPTPAAVRARSLTRIYTVGAVEVIGVDRVDLTIPAADFVVLKGDSGSGKSTLLSLLGGLDHLTSGELSVAGRDLSRCSEADLTQFRRTIVGMIFQTFNLLPTLDVLENVCLPALMAGRRYRA
jgi:ABC-type glutathione transport system ATPase component